MSLRQRGMGLARQLRGGCSALVGQGVPALSQGVPSTCFAAEEAFPCVSPSRSAVSWAASRADACPCRRVRRRRRLEPFGAREVSRQIGAPAAWQRLLARGEAAYLC